MNQLDYAQGILSLPPSELVAVYTGGERGLAILLP
jgi:hypothetical protein